MNINSLDIYPQHLHEKLSRISLVVLDVDGVLTDGQLYYGNNGEQIKAFNTLDGHGLKMLMHYGIKVAIISGRGSPMLEKRMLDLGIDDLYQNISNKMPVYENLLNKYKLTREQVAYMGDDIPDYPLLNVSGLAVCPQNAHIILKNTCDWTIDIQGGNGAVRRLCDAVIIAKYGVDELLKQHKA
jgi:3-deoxy-D-manno-octulosonate 8-phosphate phosphatase (KDO 8-P phosphatase)